MAVNFASIRYLLASTDAGLFAVTLQNSLLWTVRQRSKRGEEKIASVWKNGRS